MTAWNANTPNLTGPKVERARGLSLRATLAICFGGLQLIVVVSVILLTFFSSERALLRQSDTLMNAAGMNVVGHVSSFLAPARQSLDATRKLAENQILELDDDTALERHLFQQLQIAPQLAGIYYATPGGRFVYVMRTQEDGQYRTKIIDDFAQDQDSHPARFIWRDDHFSELKVAADPADTYEARTRPWFQSVAQSGRPVWTAPYIFFTTRKPGITYAVPINAPDGSIIGILGIDLQVNAISDFLADVWDNQPGTAIVMNDTGEIVAHPSLVLIQEDADYDHPKLTMINDVEDFVARLAFGSMINEGLNADSDKLTTSINHEGDRYVALMTAIPEPDLGWLIGIYAPEDAFIGEIRQARRRSIWTALVIAALTSLLALKLADWINRPLQAYSDRTKLISLGERPPVDGLQSPYRELDETSKAITSAIKRQQRIEMAYGQTFDLASRGMAQILPDDGRFLRVNDELSELLGYKKSALENASLDEILPKDGAATLDTLRTALLRDSELIEEIKFLRLDGKSIWLRLNAILIRDEQGQPDHILAIFDDVSAEKQTEELASQLKRDLSHVVRVNLMGEMASGLAHELNQPLSAISHNIDAAQQTLVEMNPVDPELAEILGDIDRQTQRAGNIIRALRDIVRKDGGRMAPFDLLQLTRQSMVLLAAETKANNIAVNLTGDAPVEVVGNRTQIAQVFVNLLRNAVDAIESAPSASGDISIRFETQAEVIKVEISDSGPGVAADVSLFSTFDTLKPGGLGLGLSICRSIVEVNGGRIWHEPMEGHGARFCFTLKRPTGNTTENTS